MPSQVGQIIDHFRFHLEQKVDIPAEESRQMDVAAQFENEPDCYGWSNESYFSTPRWRNPNRLIAPGRYRVDVTTNHLGGKLSQSYVLVNQNGGIRLEEI